ncbi:MAG: hypothetical protein QM747_21120 [Nocardioides sp.]
MHTHLRLAGAGIALAALLGFGAFSLAGADHHQTHAPDRHTHSHVAADADDPTGPGGYHPGSPGTLSGN